MAKVKTKSKKKVEKKALKRAKVYVSSSFNNTLVTVCDLDGNVIAWNSSGLSGYKGTRKATPYAATVAVDNLMKKLMEENGLREAEVYLKGPGGGREAALRAIRALGISIELIADVTPIPHDGPRPKKRRRA